MNNKLNSEFCKCGIEAIYTKIGAKETISYNVKSWIAEINAVDVYFTCTKCSKRIPKKVETEAFKSLEI